MQLITQKLFSDNLDTLHNFKHETKIAVAVSGGGDSMALGYLLASFCKKHKIDLHVLTVDHGLRADSKKEARSVGSSVREWPSSVHKILVWRGEKPKSRIQEEARNARYRLMSEYCRKHDIGYLFLAHHGDDQVETFLFRLAKGSGVDGLAVMPSLQEKNGVTLVRPLLRFGHEDLIRYCKRKKIIWIEDPSNVSKGFARVRLRQSRAVLAEEGLTPERILGLAKRLERTRNALEQITDNAWKSSSVHVGSERIEIGLAFFLNQPEEIALRLLQKSLGEIGKPRAYPPSLQILEKITGDILKTDRFKAATLAGCVIRIRRAKQIIEILPEPGRIDADKLGFSKF